MEYLLPLLILIPLVGSVLNGLVIRPRQARRAGVIASLCAGLPFLCSITLWLALVSGHAPFSISFDWFEAGNLTVRWGFAFDSLTAVMALVVTGIGTVIHVYSIGYMSEDRTPSRYFAYLNLFLASMLCLILADSLPVLFVGWEGVGLCSYLLIGYWYQDLKNANAGMKAFLVNRIGDAGFLIGIFLCYRLFHSLQFSTMAELIAKSNTLDWNQLNLAALFLFIGAVGKSAQIPLYVWLPDAMAGPTPVSALIHAATMVTAGIYLIARMGFLYQVTPGVRLVIAIIGTATALFAATIALAQRDIKKVLAYSTISQLGLMFLALGVGNFVAAIFHVVTHAFFKALLFLGAGSVIHALGGEQDMFKMGGLRKTLPKTFATFTIGTAAICGLPPLSGFFSKDTILYSVLSSEHYGFSLWVLASTASFLTSIYMTRLYALVFLGEYRGSGHPHESPPILVVPLVVLAIGSAVVGFLGLPHGLHLLPDFIQQFLSSVLPEVKSSEGPWEELTAMAIATSFSIVGIALALAIYGKGLAKIEALSRLLKPIQTILMNKYWVDELYELLILKPFWALSSFLARVVDAEVIDASIVFSGRIASAGSHVLGMLQAGSVQFYLLVMLIGVVFTFWLSLRGTLF